MNLAEFKTCSEEYLASYGNMSRNTQDQKRRGVEKDGRRLTRRPFWPTEKACWDIPETPLRSIYPG